MTQFNTPWEVLTFEDDGYADVRDARGLTICNVPLHTAAYIVRCVNIHDALVDALKAVLLDLKAVDAAESHGLEFIPSIYQAEIALAKSGESK